MSTSNNSFCDKVVEDLLRVFNEDSHLIEFEIVPTPSSENKNSSPVLRGGCSLGLESWVIRHVLPHANKKVLDSNSRNDPDSISPYLLTLNLLVPDMATVWNRRRELILKKKISVGDEMRLTRMTLSRKPKCNEALAHRRWLITGKHVVGDGSALLREELKLVDVIADRYHSNYHAWTHRQWALQHLVPRRDKGVAASLLAEVTKRDLCHVFTTTPLPVYLHDLATNLRFVSSHVSDHSGFHHRKFLLSQVFNILQSFDTINGDLGCVDGEVEKEALLLYSNLKPTISDFFQCEEQFDSQLTEYLTGLQFKVSLFDVVMGVILAEIKSNTSFNSLYDDHEALWYFRRFLVHEFEVLLVELKNYCNNNYDADRGKLESNRNSLKREVKACHCKNCEVVAMYAAQLLDFEDATVKCSAPSTRSVQNYSKWLRQVSRLRTLL